MLIYCDWRLITGCVCTCAHFPACIYLPRTAYVWVVALLCACNLSIYLFVFVLNSRGLSDSKAIHCKPTQTSLHTSLLTQQWFFFLNPPPHQRLGRNLSGGIEFLCPSTPCTEEYIAHTGALSKEGLNDTGIDAEVVSGTARLSRIPRGRCRRPHSVPSPPHRLQPFPHTHG